MSGDSSFVETCFASPGRADGPTLAAQRLAFLSEPVAVSLLEAMPGPALVLNANRQIVAVNSLVAQTFHRDAERLVGLRPGEVLLCVHADERAGGCGTTRHCAHCGIVNAVLACLVTGRRTTHEARVRTHAARDGGAMDVRVHASALKVGGARFVVVGIEDVAADRRREVLERLFFGDMLRSLGEVSAIAERLQEEPDPAHDRADREALRSVAGVALDQARSQRQLWEAETGQLEVHPGTVDLAELLESVAARAGAHPAARGRDVRIEHGRACRLNTDPEVLGRAVGDLLRNAIEATPVGGTVAVSCELEHRTATISVHNDGRIPEAVQLQIFERSFTTREGAGRGLGTYGVKLLVERYLGGQVEFVSDDRVGTLFVIVVPDWAERQRAA